MINESSFRDGDDRIGPAAGQNTTGRRDLKRFVDPHEGSTPHRIRSVQWKPAPADHGRVSGKARAGDPTAVCSHLLSAASVASCVTVFKDILQEEGRENGEEAGNGTTTTPQARPAIKGR